MKRSALALLTSLCVLAASAQLGPNVTDWLFNTTNIMGRHYVAGNSTPIQDAIMANVQQVDYSANWAYVHTHGIPAYITGPFLDGNPSLATDRNAIFKIPRNPVQNTGTPTATNAGNIGAFINGVALFDYRDGVAWNATTNALCGGPGNPTCPGGPGATQAWNRDAIPAERAGFDCAKAHPAMGNYHHHQNPSAFNLDLVVISNICDLYAADGLYAIDAAQHSPLLGFAYDGFPIYGAYGYANTDGTGGVVRMQSSYQLRSITVRNTSPTGQAVTATTGTAVGTGAATATVTGLVLTGALGTATASGATVVQALPDGVSATLALGTTQATGGATGTGTGQALAAAIGTPTPSGTAVATPVGQWSELVLGIVVAHGGTTATATPEGQALTSAIGSALARGDATAPASPVAVTMGLGAAVARVSVQARPAGLAMTTSLGEVDLGLRGWLEGTLGVTPALMGAITIVPALEGTLGVTSALTGAITVIPALGGSPRLTPALTGAISVYPRT